MGKTIAQLKEELESVKVENENLKRAMTKTPRYTRAHSIYDAIKELGMHTEEDVVASRSVVLFNQKRGVEKNIPHQLVNRVREVKEVVELTMADIGTLKKENTD